MESPIDFNNPVSGEKVWKEESNNRLKDRGSCNRVININYIYIVFILVILSGVCVFYYLGTNNYLKSDINSVCNNTCQATVCTPVTCGACQINLTCGNAISNLTIYVNNTYLNNTNHS